MEKCIQYNEKTFSMSLLCILVICDASKDSLNGISKRLNLYDYNMIVTN